jgi:hypothetical protein
MPGTLSIRDRVFDVASATLSAGVSRESGGARVSNAGVWLRKPAQAAIGALADWRCDWMLNVQGVSRPIAFPDLEDVQYWQPRAYSESLPVTVSGWREFDGLTIDHPGPQTSAKCTLAGPFFSLRVRARGRHAQPPHVHPAARYGV